MSIQSAFGRYLETYATVSAAAADCVGALRGRKPQHPFAVVHNLPHGDAGYIFGILSASAQLKAFSSRSAVAADFVVMVDQHLGDASLCELSSLLVDAGVDRVLPVEYSVWLQAAQNLGKGVWSGTFTKLAAHNLTGYTRVLVLDSDTYIAQPISHAFTEYSSPAMTWWPNHRGTMEPNSGVLLLTPSTDETHSLLQRMRMSPWARTSRKTREKFVESVYAAARERFTSTGRFELMGHEQENDPMFDFQMNDGQQSFLYAFYTMAGAKLYHLPPSFNVRSRDASTNASSPQLKYRETFRLAANLHIMHFTHLKPWKRKSWDGWEEMGPLLMLCLRGWVNSALEQLHALPAATRLRTLCASDRSSRRSHSSHASKIMQELAVGTRELLLLLDQLSRRIPHMRAVPKDCRFSSGALVS